VRSTCNSIRKAAIPLCGLMSLAVSGCGGGDGGSTAQPAPPLTVTAQILYSFGGTSTDAMGPSGVLIQGSDGNVYGTTYRGGLAVAECRDGAATSDPYAIGCGTVFKISPTGEETVLHLFAAAPADGVNPGVLIQGSDGNFYGTTAGGGTNNVGTVFGVTPEGVETILYSFTGGPDGAGAVGLVQGSDGNFYGTTSGGGANNFGTVFKLTPAGVETVLYSFTGTSGDESEGDGAFPVGQLIQGADGNFYGVTFSGGEGASHDGQYGGTVFKVTPDGIETILHRFSGPDGESPVAGLMQGSDGNFYGTTPGGNTTSGTVFKLTPEGVETTLYTFGSDGALWPYASLIQGSDGNFYGTTEGGGNADGGTMFQLTPAGVVTVLYSFPNTSGENDGTQLPGAEPNTNLIQGGDGNLYGTALQNGAYDRGYFFKLVLN
jgi:uncharacterized repeat protein (TIGR03803 family)